MITRQAIQERLDLLLKEREELIGRTNAYNGAIEDCQYWLKIAEQAEKEGEDKNSPSMPLNGKEPTHEQEPAELQPA